jgi:16S rRNA (cytidine1402-2'-O)-methyltransferase
VATPIGNLEDITLRALRVLREVDLIAAEDTRVTRRLLTHHGIATRLTSYYGGSERARIDSLLAALESADVALVSDAGMPTVSDPGEALVQAAQGAGHRVVPIPGPSAVLAALAASGLPIGAFTFVGFLPRKSGERRRALAALTSLPHALVLFEAPTRLVATMRDALAELGDRPTAVARELTKLHEEIARGRLSELIAQYEATPPRGEITLVIGPPTEVPEHQQASEEEVAEALRAAVARGLKPRQAAAAVSAETGVPTRDLYRTLLGLDTT